MNRVSLGPLWWFVIAGSAVSLAVIATGSVRGGGLLLAVVLAVTGIGRIVLSDRLVGALVIRSRGVDGAAFFILAAAVAVLFSVVKLTPLVA